MKKTSLLIVLTFFAVNVFAQVHMDGNSTGNVAVKGGVGLGTILAIVISWSRNKSVLWAIFHAICGWFYVIYFVIVREPK
jgi:hypothetical protein